MRKKLVTIVRINGNKAGTVIDEEPMTVFELFRLHGYDAIYLSS